MNCKKVAATTQPFHRAFLYVMLTLCLILSVSTYSLFVQATGLNFEHMFDEHGLAMLVIDFRTGRIINANQAAANFYGYSISDLESMTIHEINELDDEAIEAEMSAAAAADRNYFVFEHRMSDGETRTVEVYSYPYEIDGRPMLFSIIRDITPRLEAEQEAQQRTLIGMLTMLGALVLLVVIILLLLKNRAERNRNMKELFQLSSRYKAFITASNTGAWEYNRKSGTMSCSPEYYALRGVEIEETDFLVSNNVMEVVFDHVHPNDREVAMDRFYRYINDPEGLYENQFRIRHADGGWRWILSRGKTLLDENGKQTEITVGTHIDITASIMREAKLMESERRYKQLAEQSRTISWEVDENGLYTYVSDVAEKVIGYKPHELVGSMHYYDLHPYEGREVFKNQTMDMMRRKESIKGYLNKIMTKNGTDIWVSTYGGPLLREDGSLRGYWGSDIDVTELQKAREEAEAANAAKSIFLGNMTHELKTPLHGVIGANQLLETTQLTDEQQKYVDLEKQTSQMLLKIINDILDYTKLESDYLELQPAAVNLHELNEHLNQLFSMKAKKKNLRYINTVDPDVPKTIMADEHRVRQILINLLGNAVKFTDDGSVTLQISRKTHPDPNKARLVFKVIDTGKGIPLDQADSIFERFHQVTDETHAKYEGTGLGLPISRNLAELMGGSLTVESVEGKGSTFIFECAFEVIKEATE